MPEPTKLKVFLCHASQDKPVVRDLYKKLATEGWIDPWLDEVKLWPGQVWENEIEKALEMMDIVLVLLSKTSVTREGYIQKELKYVLDIALEKPDGSVFIVPIRLDDNCPLPRKIRQWQYVNYFPGNETGKAYERLIGSLKIQATAKGIAIQPELPRNEKKELDFGSTDVRRLPVYFLLECSDEMRGDHIKTVEQGVQLIYDELLGQPQAVEAVNISIIAYSTYAQQIVPLTPISSFSVPPLDAGGVNNLGNALHFLSDCTKRDLIATTPDKKGDYKANIFWITAQKPTDDWANGLAYLNANSRKINGIVALAMGKNVDMDILRQIASNVLFISAITPDLISSFFKFVNESQPARTESQPVDNSGHSLPPPPSGFEFKL